MNQSIIAGLSGGLLIGLASLLYLLLNGRIAGISGILAGVLARRPDFSVRLSFLVGLMLGGAIMFVYDPSLFSITVERPIWIIIVAGFLVGFGSVLGNGCTSGHGVCGMGRLSIRSFVSVAIFLPVAILTATLSSFLLQ